MARTPWIRSTLGSAGVCALVCVLGFYGTGSAQPPKSHEPFANNVAQQAEMVQLLRDISRQLKEQNDLLRTGPVRVTVVQAPVK